MSTVCYRDSSWTTKIDATIDACFSLDIALNFFASFPDKRGNENLLKIFNILFSSLLICHWLACLMAISGPGFLGEYGDDDDDDAVEENDLRSAEDFDGEAQKLDTISAGLEHHELPVAYRERVLRYLRAYYRRRTALDDEHAILEDLSHELREELSYRASLPIIFTTVKNAGDLVVRVGDSGEGMYVIARGNGLQLGASPLDAEPDPTKVRDLGAGESFGEEVLLGLEKSYAYTVDAVTALEMCAIPTEEFLKCFNGMPDILARIKANLKGTEVDFFDKQLRSHLSAAATTDDRYGGGGVVSDDDASVVSASSIQSALEQVLPQASMLIASKIAHSPPRRSLVVVNAASRNHHHHQYQSAADHHNHQAPPAPPARPRSSTRSPSPAREAAMRRVRARSVKVQWTSEAAPSVDVLRGVFEAWGPISTVKVKGKTALILYRDGSSVATALGAYRGRWTVRGTSDDSSSRSTTPTPTPPRGGAGPKKAPDRYELAEQRQRGRALERLAAAPARRHPDPTAARAGEPVRARPLTDPKPCDAEDTKTDESYVVVDAVDLSHAPKLPALGEPPASAPFSGLPPPPAPRVPEEDDDDDKQTSSGCQPSRSGSPFQLVSDLAEETPQSNESRPPLDAQRREPMPPLPAPAASNVFGPPRTFSSAPTFYDASSTAKPDTNPPSAAMTFPPPTPAMPREVAAPAPSGSLLFPAAPSDTGAGMFPATTTTTPPPVGNGEALPRGDSSDSLFPGSLRPFSAAPSDTGAIGMFPATMPPPRNHEVFDRPPRELPSAATFLGRSFTAAPSETTGVFSATMPPPTNHESEAPAEPPQLASDTLFPARTTTRFPATPSETGSDIFPATMPPPRTTTRESEALDGSPRDVASSRAERNRLRDTCDDDAIP
ncbi:hypothetical protein CTAYLR_001836 [Chrysophaeum taylorii]|uniref:Cyclic nucleotide-binding domain-containing protein n=1 Tax=Chrysophaeum taylorii TaxID=2483200 RepID=A0AAD7XJ28_9STRA|nr:hypothetical protein CTAYLR_001836 [Chrysophaeum taylorii]